MKKRLVLTLIILIAGFILYATLVPKLYQKEITVKAPLLKIHDQLSYINYIANWYVPFTNLDTAAVTITGNEKIISDSTTLTILQLNGLSSLFKIAENDNSLKVLFSVNGDTGIHHTVKLSYKNTLWQTWFGNSNIIHQAEKSLQSLKNIIEDSKINYGYSIGVTEVTDTTFLFTSKVVANNNKKASLKNLYESLIQYAKEKNAGYNGTRILYLSAEGKDSIRLYASIGITSNTESMPLNGPIALRRMPYKRNLIVADYKDRFGQIGKVFSAMEQYRTDNSMTSMAIPFIKFITEGIEFDDDQIIEAKGFFPIL